MEEFTLIKLCPFLLKVVMSHIEVIHLDASSSSKLPYTPLQSSIHSVNMNIGSYNHYY
jgi:hypothetical protein